MKTAAHVPAWLPFLMLLTVITIVAGACGAGASPSPNPDPTPRILDGSSWRAVLINDVSPVVGAEPKIQFDRGQASGTTGCNTYSAPYLQQVFGGFSIGSLTMSQMACEGPRGAQETVVVAILRQANQFAIPGGATLKLFGLGGSIVFEELPA